MKKSLLHKTEAIFVDMRICLTQIHAHAVSISSATAHIEREAYIENERKQIYIDWLSSQKVFLEYRCYDICGIEADKSGADAYGGGLALGDIREGQTLFIKLVYYIACILEKSVKLKSQGVKSRN